MNGVMKSLLNENKKISFSFISHPLPITVANDKIICSVEAVEACQAWTYFWKSTPSSSRPIGPRRFMMIFDCAPLDCSLKRREF